MELTSIVIKPLLQTGAHASLRTHVYDIIYEKHLNLHSPLSESVWGGFVLKIQFLYRKPQGSSKKRPRELQSAGGRWNPYASVKLWRWNMPWGAGISPPQ